MKYLQCYKKQLLILGCLVTFPFANWGQSAYRETGSLRWDYSGSHVERFADGDSLGVTFHISPLIGLNRQEVVYLHLVYISADSRDSLQLEPVCVAGKKRYRVIERRRALHNLRPGEPGFGGVSFIRHPERTPLTVRQSFPFERWMADGRLVVREHSYGCAECGMNENTGIVSLADIPLFGVKDYVYDFIKPEKVLVKHYTDSFECKVTFPVARHDLRKTFADNRRELVRLEQFVSENLNITGTTLKEVHIEGYASPEGGFEYNKSLAQRRTQTLSDYIISQYPVLKEAPVYCTEGVGEDWEGLKSAIGSSGLHNREEILFIIEQSESDMERESALRKLDGGNTYRVLLEDFYPGLRRTTFGFSFDVRPYTIEEIPGVFETNPECLSQYEMYQLAELYASRDRNPLPVYRRAYEQFSGDITATLNYANALLKYDKDANGALRVLEAVKDDSRALFTMAVAHDMKGDWRKAEELLRQAAACGDVRAKSFKAKRTNG